MWIYIYIKHHAREQRKMAGILKIHVVLGRDFKNTVLLCQHLFKNRKNGGVQHLTPTPGSRKVQVRGGWCATPHPSTPTPRSRKVQVRGGEDDSLPARAKQLPHPRPHPS